jgi:putative colanic acid biosynthesis UDP-glucose lipid carrier transferase
MTRLCDIVFSFFGLLFLSPLFLVVALWIVIDDPGPVFYRQQRVGRHNRDFGLLKFRSMRVDSGKVKLTTLQNDDRIFPFGKFIRKTKIDEMPQALNILFGDMSVVGPRPEDTVNADKMYQGEYKHILDVKPGLTSPASLYDYTHGEKYEDEALYEKEFVPQKLILELYYVKHQSFLYDIKLILKTAWIIIQTFCGKEEFEKPKELASC